MGGVRRGNERGSGLTKMWTLFRTFVLGRFRTLFRPSTFLWVVGGDVIIGIQVNLVSRNYEVENLS